MKPYSLLLVVLISVIICYVLHVATEMRKFKDRRLREKFTPDEIYYSPKLKTPIPETTLANCTRSTTPSNMLSQSGEDKILIEIFPGMCDGRYVELGALDGLTYSNTYAFNQDMGWKGVLIEPSPTSFSSLRVNRPNEISVVHAAVCKERSQLHFIDHRNAIAGLWEFSSPTFRKNFWPGVLREHGTPVYCLPMSDILAGSGQPSPFFADFLSLDVEGGELQVLQSLNFNVTAFGVVIVEADGTNSTKDQLVRDLLEVSGYSYLGPIKQNDWFTNDRWDDIYSKLGLLRPSK